MAYSKKFGSSTIHKRLKRVESGLELISKQRKAGFPPGTREAAAQMCAAILACGMTNGILDYRKNNPIMNFNDKKLLSGQG